MAAKGTMKISVIGDASKFNRVMNNVQGKLGKLAGAAAKFGKMAAAGIGAAGAAAVAGAFKIADFGDEIAKSAGKAGLGVEQFQELRFAFEQGGVEAGTFNTAVQKFNKRLGESATTGGTADDAFQRLGISLRDADGNVRDATGAIEEVLPKLAQIESNSERAAVAGDLFGQRAGPELAGALSEGVEGIEAARQKAQDLGIVMGEEAAEKAEQFSDSFDDIKRSTLGLLRTGLTPLMTWMADKAFPFIKNKIIPALSDFRDWLGPKLSSAAEEVGRFFRTKVQPAFEALGDWWDDNGDDIMRTARGVRDAAVDMARKIERWIDDHLLPPLNAFGDLVTSLLGGSGEIRSDISDFVAWLGPFWSRHGDDIEEEASETWTAIRDEIEDLLKQAKAIIQGVTSTISGDWSGFLDTLQEDFDAFDEDQREEWESFMKGLRTTVAVISDLIVLDWKSALDRVRGRTDEHAGEMEGDWTDHTGKLRSIASASYDIIKGNWSDAIDTIKEDFLGLDKTLPEMWNDLWSGIHTRVSEWMGAVGNVIKGKIDDVVGWFIDLPGRVSSALGNLGSKIASKFSFDIPGISFSGQGDGPGFGVPGVAGGQAMDRAQAAMEGLPVSVTSTYRTPAENARVGGSPTSFHLDKSNPAVDIGGPMWALDVVAARLREMNQNRELLWRTAGHFDHVHVAHSGGEVTRRGIDPIRPDEVIAKLQSGETVLPRNSGGGASRSGGGVTVNVNVHGSLIHERELVDQIGEQVVGQIRRKTGMRD